MSSGNQEESTHVGAALWLDQESTQARSFARDDVVDVLASRPKSSRLLNHIIARPPNARAPHGLVSKLRQRINQGFERGLIMSRRNGDA
jgi:hypothetical protein